MYTHVVTAPDETLRATSPDRREPAGLVFRTVLRGAVLLSWRGRRVRLDADSWLVLDAGAACTVTSDPRDQPLMLAVTVAGGECDAARVERAHRRAPVDAIAPTTFAESLRSIDGPVGRRLHAIATGLAEGRDDAWARSERIALVQDAIDEEQRLRERGARLECVKPATREALLRRLLIAADFIASNHDEPLSLDQMARAGSLSRFHFVRLFGIVHGATPHAYLLQKRTAVARRHLADGVRCDDACARAGFGSRSALFRNLRKPSPAGDGSGPCSRSA